MSYNSLESCIKRYILHLKEELNYSKWTINNNEKNLNTFINWCRMKGFKKIHSITQKRVLDYQLYLYQYEKKNGAPLSLLTQRQRIACLRKFFSYLNKNNYILYNPASELELPKKGYSLPKYVLKAHEIEAVLNEVDIETATGIRDRAILECFYSTGIRRAELLNLCIFDIDFSRGTLMVRKGKGNKDRLIPIGDRASKWINKYIKDVRHLWQKEEHKEALFLNKNGTPIQGCFLGQMVRSYVKKADVGKTGSCHLFRHSMATLMLENGASIRYVQQMLGHESINTTETYTHISISRLKDVHRQSHPKAYACSEIPDLNTEKLIKPLESYIDTYLSFLKKDRGYIDSTLNNRKNAIHLFLKHSNIETLKDMTANHFNDYENHVLNLKNKDGQPLDSTTQYSKLFFVKGFIDYLSKHNLISFTLNTEIEKPYYGKRVIELLSVEDIEKVIDKVDTADYVGLRDRAVLEILYSSGMKRRELTELKLIDLNIESKTLLIGNREIPLLDRTIYWLNEYLNNSRNKFVKKDSKYLFLTQKSAKCGIDSIVSIIKRYTKKANLNKEFSCYVFRSSWKAFMKENGVSKDFIYAMEGKSNDLSLTQLREILYKHHPAKMKTYVKQIEDNKNALKAKLNEYLIWMKMHNTSKRTIENRKSYVSRFIDWCIERGIEEADNVSKDILKRYQRYVYHLENERTGKELSSASKRYMMSHVISFFSYLVKMGELIYNPGADLELPKTVRSLPSNVLTEEEAESILNQADIVTPRGIRDRAILEILYSTGMRRKEITSLRVSDIDTYDRSVMILGGKGLKDRVIPIGKRAIEWITRYVEEVRPLFLTDTMSDYLFLTGWGTKLNEGSLGIKLKEYVDRAGIKKKGSSLLFRHTMATLMLENGADLRYIQQMLGHKRLETTQVYTHVSIGKLKEVHDRTHPARLRKPKDRPSL